MFLMDWESKGHLVRFYFGTDKNYWGDDWDDVPYEHNAGIVSDKYVKEVLDVAFSFDVEIEEACENFINSPYSKEDFKNGEIFMRIKDDKRKLRLTFNISKDDFMEMISPFATAITGHEI